MIVKKKDGYHLMSKDGSKHLGGPYKTREEAVNREKQVQFFKSKPSSSAKSPSRKKSG